MGTVEVHGVGASLVSRATISAVVTRADGTVEDLGIIADSGPRIQRSLLQRAKDALWPKH